MELTVSQEPISARPFHGLGVQADAYIYDDDNRRMGVTDKDLALFESRLAALRPGIVRIFAGIDLFNPSFDAKSYQWDLPGYGRLVHHLRNVKAAGAKVNVCMGPWTNEQMTHEGMEKTAVDFVEHLVGEEGLDNVAWVCLFNEPDGIYAHDSALYRKVFGDDAVAKKPPWSQYVRKNVWAHEELQRRRLHPAVKLIVADTVWGHPIRAERMRMAVEDFAGLDVACAYHHYNPEYPERYDPWQYEYPGMAAEAEMFRRLVGPEREMVIWEFNNGGPGFGGFYSGTGRHGEDLAGSFAGAVEIADKVLTALDRGVDGMSLWCLCDSYYNCGLKTGPMRFGLWRFRWEGWRPRPCYYYYAALVHAFRPGARLHRVAGTDAETLALAAEADGGWTVAVLNLREAASRVDLLPPAEGEARRLRVYRELLPTSDEMPAGAWQPAAAEKGRITLDLEPWELTVVRVEGGQA